MDKLIEDNYNSIVNRGLITPYTTDIEFFDKLEEEVNEVWDSLGSENESEEMADVILTVLNWAYHKGHNIEKALKDKIQKNFDRSRINTKLPKD